ncbi:unnamed protein product [Paramecium sonneborni]|uniref:Uncharacterized protein n=1 Tax=Paramecium sonneborni TaxID=65129 RepID=A0A8S1MLU0_9CILI|nr:unnamed protein product [Paramecium sonneborni]
MVKCYEVNENDKCKECNQLKSQLDCVNVKFENSCEWIKDSEKGNGKCQKREDKGGSMIIDYKSYCDLINESDKNCRLTNGCAYVNKKCVVFGGCSAFEYPWTQECQGVSYQCISNGKQCINISDCKDYTEAKCEIQPSQSGIRRCKWDKLNNICKDYQCSDSDDKLITDIECDQWLKGCITRGMGCWDSPLPQCSTYRGNQNTCSKYIGSDGYCELGIDDICQSKKCENAPIKYNNDLDCQKYQVGCITNGKGCIFAKIRPLCQTYMGDKYTCQGYIGIDGICQGDENGIYCRNKKCQDAPKFNTDQLCKEYQSNCITNGISCVSELQLCENYYGNQKECFTYIGKDGKCKGQEKVKESQSQCTLRICNDAPINLNTDIDCNLYQNGCVTTGFGCILFQDRKSCSSYEGNSEKCLNFVGIEGNCMWQTGNNCSPRNCKSAPIEYYSKCSNWLKDCVSTQNGCVMKTECQYTIHQISCELTDGCFWQSNCNNNTDCSYYTKESICISNTANLIVNGIINQIKCVWSYNQCRQLQCYDLIGQIYKEDINCQKQITTCISDRKNSCITKYDCSKLTGNQQTCLSYQGYCTNLQNSDETTPCILRQCNDNLDLTTNEQCNNFLPGCVSNGKGCVEYETQCSQMQGTQSICSQYFGYFSGSPQNFKTIQCYNHIYAHESDYCLNKSCDMAQNMENQDQCDQFLKGCVYNGNGGCLDPQQANCDSYYGDENFCEQAIVGQNKIKYCFGTQIKSQCVKRECWHKNIAYSDYECEQFRSGCLLLNQTCVDQSTKFCKDQQGTEDSCQTLFGGIQIYNQWTKIQCLKKFQCQERQCGDIINPNNSQDCINYKSTCRFFKVNHPCINANECNKYSIPDTATTDQQKSYGMSSKTTGSETCKWNGSTCYAIKNDCAYSIPNNQSNYSTNYNYCISFQNNQGIQCSYAIGNSTCSYQDTCEKIVNHKDAKTCNDFLQQNGQCQKGKNSYCYTTSNDCTNYQFPQLYTYNQKLELCLSLKIIDDSIQLNVTYKSCTYIEGSKCSNINKCEDIKSANSQKDCDKHLSDCLYFEKQCYSQVYSCYNLLFPKGITSDTMKSLFCSSMKDNNSYCSLNQDKIGCEVKPYTNCNEITQVLQIPSQWDQQSTNMDHFCLAHNDNTRTIQCINDGGIQCKAGTCEDIPSPLNQNDCDNHIIGCLYFLGKCLTNFQLLNDQECQDTSKIPFPQQIINLSIIQKIEYCQLFKNNVTDKKLYCLTKTNIYGYTCRLFENHCRDSNCEDAINPESQLDCDTLVFQKQCKYLQGTCYNFQNVQRCTYGGGNYCVQITSCEQYNVSAETDKLKICNELHDVNYNNCTYIWGDNCITQKSCSEYDGNIDNLRGPQLDQERIQCYSVKSIQNISCVQDESQTRKCRDQNCEDILYEQDCVNYILGCIYYNFKCFQKKECYQYQTQGDNDEQKKQWCEGVQNINGIYCKWNNNIGCQDRSCNDVQYYSDFDCQKYLSKCKTDGIKCIDQNLSCNQIRVIKPLCSRLLNSNGKDKCKSDELSSNIGQCDNRTCYDNISATTDTECNEFMRGCVTRGFGCIPNSEPCTSYRGTQTECEQFKYLINKEYIYCSGSKLNISTSICKERICSDNTVAVSNQECQDYLKGCLTKGVGCISESAWCSEYQGNQVICSQFRGNFGRDLCYNNNSSGLQSTCIKKECYHINGIDNQSCNDGYDQLTCVYDGTKCISYGMKCSYFKGNQNSCSKYIAIDGPCKATSLDDFIISNCTQRICSEAPNTLQTDIDCYTYHPSCYTTGYGCTSIKQCDYLITQTACQHRKDCSWTHFCNQQYEKCDQIQDANYSICFNSKVKNQQCSYNENSNQCRSQNCEDLPHYITSHDLCNQLNQNCTTNGMGCILQGLCSQYTSEPICFYAKGKQKCIWDQNNKVCRDMKCLDFHGRTDAECEQQMSGCLTDGTKCINGQSCNEYSNQNYCILSKTGPCLWVQNKCINFTKCEDAKMTTFQECQLISSQCTTNSFNCIPITYCSQYLNKESCIYGLDQICGWNETCQKFKACSDLKSYDTDTCRIYHNTCISDGTQCIQQAQKCSQYITAYACSNPSTEGPCIWNSKSLVCNSKQCNDYTYSTHTECQYNNPQCITNGTKCIQLSKCSSYDQLSCYKGTDGLCIYSYPLDGSTSIKFCRPKECQDIFFAQDNQTCQNSLPDKQCVSNGTFCIPKAKCETYTTFTACQGGGLDGQNPLICAFIPKEKNSSFGTCKLFSKCSDAEQDQITCKTNPSCYWDQHSNKCIDQTCQTFSSGLNCNPLPNFDGTKHTICIFENGKCSTLEPNNISDSKACFIKSAQTHTWNSLTNQCEKCLKESTPNIIDQYANIFSAFITLSLII